MKTHIHHLACAILLAACGDDGPGADVDIWK